MLRLQDAFGRRFTYLRLSVTEACNFRCAYCLPDGYRATPGLPAPLTPAEVRRLAAAFAGLGVEKVRLTGGEPTVRKDLVQLVEAVAGTPGIRKVALTTNGYDLVRLARPLREAGLTALNVSVDSLDPRRFEEVTRRPLLSQVLAGIEAALAEGFAPVKVNAVLLRGLGEAELARFVGWTRDVPISVRFIELMRTGCDQGYYAANHRPVAWVEEALAARGFAAAPRGATDGPAVEYRHPAHAGTVGVIAPTAAHFCEGCNRLRVSSQGALRLCLFGEKDASLRPLLQSDGQGPALAARLAELVGEKPRAHRLSEGRAGLAWNLAGIGG
ncbi:GTP 3',8-cyclase MoaA [Anaeromyxobacter paludicola]|uniref:GTP 3',8-cyclase n=1 Tax=Anaeromyxobacter paludicola TaxID=2918171 RepID=A0ABM7X9L6_9BACT|nr:GTP 3',8-cyclase MoaA [Anaeromyxobacter paludicola]BDG08510.1 GTP 3',8-cyclase [Anaeromyxobacter paludicola]